MRPLKIAMLGTRGIPGGYSGFETAVEQIGVRLAERGHLVDIYCRSHATTSDAKEYMNCRLIHLPTIQNKYLDTMVHTALSTVHMSLLNRPDVALYFIAGNSPMVLVARGLGVKTVLNVDGLDSQREKWPPAAKRYLRFAEWLSSWAPDVTVTDSQEVQKFYLQRFGRDSVFIPYGAETPESTGNEFLEKYGLEPRKYILFVGRLVPENCAHLLVEAFERIESDIKLVIVGDAPYAGEYIDKLKATRDPRVIFTGYLFGEGYRQLSREAYVFAIPTEVGGTHPVLLEAMGAGNCVLVNDHKPNLEVIGDAGYSFNGRQGATDLEAKLRHLLQHPDEVESCRDKARARVREHYSWEKVVDKYEEICYRLAGAGGPLAGSEGSA